MNMNDGTLYRRMEDLAFICDSMEAALDMASDILTNPEHCQRRDAAKSLYGIVTNIRHVRRELNDTLEKIEDGVITEAATITRDTPIGEGSALFYDILCAAANAGLLPTREPGHLDTTDFEKWYGVFASALEARARRDNWPVRFRVDQI